MLNTASEGISFYKKLEDQSLKFYEELACNEKYAEGKETFLAFAKENKKHKAIVIMAYHYVITDAIEAGFGFQGLDENNYKLNTKYSEEMSYSDVLKMVIEIEKTTYKFCTDAGETSKGLLHDISNAFLRVAKQKIKRKQKLKTLLEKILV